MAFLTMDADPYELNALKKIRLSAYAMAWMACSVAAVDRIDLFEKFLYRKLAITVKDLGSFFPGFCARYVLYGPFLDIFVQARFIDLQHVEYDVLPERPDISLDDISFREMQVNQVTGSPGDAVLGDADMEVVFPKSAGNCLCLGDIDRELFDHVPVLIVYVPMGAPVGNGQYLGIYILSRLTL